MKYLLFSALTVLLVGIAMVPAVSSQQTAIPDWVKNTAGWWAVGAIDDTEFTLALQYLVKTGIITVNSTKV